MAFSLAMRSLAIISLAMFNLAIGSLALNSLGLRSLGMHSLGMQFGNAQFASAHIGAAHFGAAHCGAAYFEEGHFETGGVGLMRGWEMPGFGAGTGFDLEIMFLYLNIEFVGHNYGGYGDSFNSGLQNARLETDESGEFSWHQGQQ